jgi:hypothetical protein
MEITNKMAGKKSEKQVNSLGKDFRSLNQRPMFGLLTGKRSRLQSKKETKEEEEAEEIEDNGLLCMVKQKGNVLVKNILTTDYDELYTEQSQLNINPVCMDHRIYVDQENRNDSFPSLQCLLGSQDGTIFIYDPLLIEPARIRKFNHNTDDAFHKLKRPTLVTWVDSSATKNPSQFVVVFEDGSIYFYDKELDCGINENYSEKMI